MSNDFVLSSETISDFEKNGVVLLKNMINNNWQRILIDAIEKDLKNPGPFLMHTKPKKVKGTSTGTFDFGNIIKN